MNILITIPGPDQAEQVLAIGRDTFHEKWHPYYSMADMEEYLVSAFKVANILEELKSRHRCIYFILLADGEPAGYAKINLGTTEKEFSGFAASEVERFYLFEKYHGTGLAHRLMDHVLEFLKDRNDDWVYLGVDVNNHRAIRFYERYGFVVFGAKVFMVGNTKDMDQLMKLDLNRINPRNPSA